MKTKTYFYCAQGIKDHKLLLVSGTYKTAATERQLFEEVKEVIKDEFDGDYTITALNEI